MPIFRRFLHKGGATAIWQTSESVDELHALFLKGPTADAPAYATLASDKRRKEWLAERLLLRCAFLRCDDIGHRADGSPYLTAGGAHVSISHSGPFIALSLSAAARIGIDLEQRGPRALRLREKFLSLRRANMATTNRRMPKRPPSRHGAPRRLRSSCSADRASR